jgi:hypothetical protein
MGEDAMEGFRPHVSYGHLGWSFGGSSTFRMMFRMAGCGDPFSGSSVCSKSDKALSERHLRRIAETNI